MEAMDVFESVGFIGVGMMGTPMLRNLVGAGYRVVAYDIDPEAMRRAVEGGAEAASSVGEVAERCNPVITILPKSDDVEEVVLGPGGVLEHGREGLVLIEMTTAYPLSTEKIAGALAGKGMRVLDAPVSGGVSGAEKGILSIMVGGDLDLFETFRPLLEVMGKNVFYMGGVGSGHTMKAVNNFLSACSMTATSEALAIATKAGLEPKRVVEVLQVSSGRSYATDFKFPRYVLPRTFDDGFRLELLDKDLNILTSLGRDIGAPTFIASTVQQIVSLAVRQGYGKRGHTSIAEFIESWAGVRIEG
jgi:3-hydroxyisobutyrate dehydrogenase-like beta-hydroxyacid dehydrogenase